MTRKAKEAHPDQFCRVARCLWRIKGGDGTPRKPCGKHPVVSAVDFSGPKLGMGPLPEPVRDDSWYEHVEVDGRWEHAYDAYHNHQASGARATKRGESMDFMLCRCTPEQRAKHIAARRDFPCSGCGRLMSRPSQGFNRAYCSAACSELPGTWRAP